jgi:uncharacterized protein (DUF736 family)
MYQPKDDSGSLFKNDKKESENHPDYKGNALIDGIEYWVSSWINTSKDGKKYMSLKFNAKDESKVTKQIKEEMSDDIPF